MRWPRLERILTRAPLSYRVVRQSGSHKTLESTGRPTLRLSFHDRQELPGSIIRKILVQDVGLSDADARALLQATENGMTIHLDVHLDTADSGSMVWWADTADIPGLTVAAPSLGELEILSREAVLEAGVDDPAVKLRLVDEAPPSSAEITARADGTEPAGTAADASRTAGHLAKT